LSWRRGRLDTESLARSAKDPSRQKALAPVPCERRSGATWNALRLLPSNPLLTARRAFHLPARPTEAQWGMRLAVFITSNLDPILDDWVAFARNQLPAARDMDEAALLDHGRLTWVVPKATKKVGEVGGEQPSSVDFRERSIAQPCAAARAPRLRSWSDGRGVSRPSRDSATAMASVIR
jgi:hypothetical protein